jgi:hypothetical protein
LVEVDVVVVLDFVELLVLPLLQPIVAIIPTIATRARTFFMCPSLCG